MSLCLTLKCAQRSLTIIYCRAIAAFETVLEVTVLNVNVTEEPVVIEGDDAAVILQRVS